MVRKISNFPTFKRDSAWLKFLYFLDIKKKKEDQARIDLDIHHFKVINLYDLLKKKISFLKIFFRSKSCDRILKRRKPEVALPAPAAEFDEEYFQINSTLRR